MQGEVGVLSVAKMQNDITSAEEAVFTDTVVSSIASAALIQQRVFSTISFVCY